MIAGGRVGAIVAGVRASRRKNALALDPFHIRIRRSPWSPRARAVEEQTVLVLEYQAPPAEDGGACDVRSSECRVVTLPRCFRKGWDDLYHIRRAREEQLAGKSQHLKTKEAMEQLATQEDNASADLRSEVSETSTADTGVKMEEAPEMVVAPEPFAKFLSRNLGKRVTAIFYPDGSNRLRQFHPDLGPLPFVDRMQLVVCFDGEELRPDFVPPTAAQKKGRWNSVARLSGCCCSPWPQ